VVGKEGEYALKTKLSKVDCSRGAPMGRSDSIPDDIETAGKLYLEKLNLVDGDYDQGGSYWGYVLDNDVYRATGETQTETVEIFVRAKDRDDAKEKVKEKFREAKFFR